MFIKLMHLCRICIEKYTYHVVFQGARYNIITKLDIGIKLNFGIKLDVCIFKTLMANALLLWLHCPNYEPCFYDWWLYGTHESTPLHFWFTIVRKEYWDVCNYLKNVDKSSYKHAQNLIYNVFATSKCDGLN
jgi:hypothetical protein